MSDAASGAQFIEHFKRALLLEGGYVESLTPAAVDSQVAIDLSNPRSQRVRRTKGPSNSLMAMMKAFTAHTSDEDDGEDEANGGAAGESDDDEWDPLVVARAHSPDGQDSPVRAQLDQYKMVPTSDAQSMASQHTTNSDRAARWQGEEDERAVSAAWGQGGGGVLEWQVSPAEQLDRGRERHAQHGWRGAAAVSHESSQQSSRESSGAGAVQSGGPTPIPSPQQKRRPERQWV